MLKVPDKDTQLCISLAGRPGNFGTRFHNFLYGRLNLNYLYKAFTTHDLPAAICGIRALGIRGCAVSMPFKEASIALVDELDPSAAAIASINTIVNDGGYLRAYNTDYLAIRQLLQRPGLDPAMPFALQGSGGMAKAVACALRDAAFRRGTLVARNGQAGPALAQRCGYHWQPTLGALRPALLVNVTPLGMAGGPDADALAFEAAAVEAADWVFDVVALPARTPVVQLAERLGKPAITGLDVATLQALEQFVLYTGVRPAQALVEEAVAFARAV
ncbi:shikimate 5-dehydrogenase [Pseudomonas typographi]|uniref:Shikimate 5-dehydrogenase n=1 Tax=Pseudomonas typographi TaxID=2715964 RepID=A0ABR7Z2F3_9PSED|nr:shikimate 5-dehydrogenase [Pseudomonas typographi]MBD1599597.1 shikimate 5-dehydrogenase [Pseudomonas typographi]